MVYIADKASLKKVIAKLISMQKKKSFDPNKYLGKVNNWGKGSVEYQRALRNEW